MCEKAREDYFPKNANPLFQQRGKNRYFTGSRRYVISVVFPMRAVFIGVSHYSASFSIEHLTRSQAVAYHHYSRLNLFRVQRSDMRGNKSMPLGDFECEEVGDYRIVCTTPESIRSDFSPSFQLHFPTVSDGLHSPNNTGLRYDSWWNYCIAGDIYWANLARKRHRPSLRFLSSLFPASSILTVRPLVAVGGYHDDALILSR